MGYLCLFILAVIFLNHYVQSWGERSSGGCYGKCDQPNCDINCFTASAAVKCPSGNCTSSVCCTLRHVAHADCRGCFCEAECKGKTCTTGCTGEECLTTCRGLKCFAECTGNKCNATCDGEQCTALCMGRDCVSKCAGKACTESSVINIVRDIDFEIYKNHAAVHRDIEKLRHPDEEIKDNQNAKNQKVVNNKKKSNKQQVTNQKKVKNDQKKKQEVDNAPTKFFESSEELTGYLNRTELKFSEIIASMSDVFQSLQNTSGDQEIIFSGNMDKRSRYFGHFPEIVTDGSKQEESKGPETFKSEELRQTSTGDVFPDFE